MIEALVTAMGAEFAKEAIRQVLPSLRQQISRIGDNTDFSSVGSLLSSSMDAMADGNLLACLVTLYKAMEQSNGDERHERRIGLVGELAMQQVQALIAQCDERIATFHQMQCENPAMASMENPFITEAESFRNLLADLTCNRLQAYGPILEQMAENDHPLFSVFLFDR